MNKKEVNTFLVQIQEGDNRAFEHLYEQTSRGMWSFIYSCIKNSIIYKHLFLYY